MKDTFHQAVENTADAVIITDKNGRIVYVNPAFEKITGFKKKEAIGKTPRVIKSGRHDDRFYKRLWTTILSGRTWRSEVINKKKNGGLIYTDHTITPIKNQQGKITQYVGIWKDVSRQKELEHQKDEFISMVGHELKTPITSLKLFIQLMQERLPSPLLDRMNNQVDKLTELIGDLLDIARLNVNKFPLKKEPFAYDRLITEIVGDIQKTVGKEHDIKIKSLPKIKINADQYRINQVLTNLLTNAIKYSPKSKKIIVSLICDKKGAIVSIRDYGIGIAKNQQKYLFSKYYRAQEDVSSNQRFTSLGLGLYISSEIVKRHGGKIWVESEEGKGSTFYFSLPTSVKSVK